ncbi:MAG: LptF/LptG family permease [Planctomycetes bacterium]|nr:LptF/LptG family permease [Planctomycetota bacterium]
MRFQRYLLVEILLNFVFVMLGIGLVTVVGALISVSFKAKGAPFYLQLEMIPVLCVTVAPYLMPVAFLMAIVSTYGRVSSDEELTAIRMAGIHPLRMTTPTFLLAGLLCMLSFWIQDQLVPDLRRRSQAILRRASKAVLETITPSLSEFAYEDRDNGFAFFLSWTHRSENGDFHNVFLTAQQEKPPETDDAKKADANAKPVEVVANAAAAQGSPPKTTPRAKKKTEEKGNRWAGRARRARIQFVENPLDPDLPLFRLELTGFEPLHNDLTGHFDDLVIYERPHSDEQKKIGRGEFESTEIYRLLRGPAFDLERAEHMGKTERKSFLNRIAKLELEVYKRESLALTPLVFALLGIPIGISIRRSNRLVALTLSVGTALVGYYPLSLFGQGLAKSGQLDAALASHLPGVAMAALGAFLMWRSFRH